jgi:hypothetical protein
MELMGLGSIFFVPNFSKTVKFYHSFSTFF